MVPNLWLAALIPAAAVAVLGGLFERFILRKLGGNVLGQVLVTLGVSFIIADLCLVVWGGDPIPIPTPSWLQQPVLIAGLAFPAYRLAVVVIAVVACVGLLFPHRENPARRDDPRRRRRHGHGARLRHPGVAPVHHRCSASAPRSPAPRGVIGGPIMSAYPGLDADMLPLALIVVILGGVGSLGGAFIGAFITGFVYTFGVAMLPDLAYVILFLPMILVIAFRPRGLFGKFAA